MNGTYRIACCCLALALGACRQTVVFDRTGGGGDPEFCIEGEERELSYTPRSPSVMVALDRSVSMTGAFSPTAATAKLTAALTALDDVSLQYRRSVRFGFVAFPGAGFICSDMTNTCCAGQATRPFADRDSFFYAAHACDGPMPGCISTDQRPTAAALNACRETYAMVGGSNGSRYVLLLTDGEPTCGNGGGCDAAFDRLTRLSNDGVSTFVVVLGNVAESECLSQMALLGNTDSAEPPFYHPATSPDALTAKVADIVGSIATGACQLELNDPVDDTNQVGLFLDNKGVARGGPDGWDFDDNRRDRITLRGAACQKFLASAANALDVRRCVVPR
jgi:hypothetical protein